VASAAPQEDEYPKWCPDCEKGIRGGAVCLTCGGSGQSAAALFREVTQLKTAAPPVLAGPQQPPTLTHDLRRLEAENARLIRLVKTQRPELGALRRIESELRGYLFNGAKTLERLHEDLTALLPSNDDDLPSIEEVAGLFRGSIMPTPVGSAVAHPSAGAGRYPSVPNGGEIGRSTSGDLAAPPQEHFCAECGKRWTSARVKEYCGNCQRVLAAPPQEESRSVGTGSSVTITHSCALQPEDDGDDELAKARETIKRLNRRCQLAEAAVNTKVEQFEQRSKPGLRSYYFQQGVEYRTDLDKHNMPVPSYYDVVVRMQRAEAELAALAAQPPREDELVEEVDCLCQAIEGHRAGALTNDGLWHYVEKARSTLARLAAPSSQEPKA
jgi:hypothetical protein